MNSGLLSMIRLKNIFPEKGRLQGLHTALTVLFLALFAFPVFPLKVTNILLILIAAGSLLAYFSKPFSLRRPALRNLIFVIPFIPYLIEFVISGFDKTAHFEFEKKLFFFTAPFFIPLCMQVLDFKNYRLPLRIFAFSVTVLTLFSFVVMLFEGTVFLAAAYENGAYLLRRSFETISGIHPTYYSLFALFAACILIEYAASLQRSLRILVIISVVLLFVFVIFIAVRIAVITGFAFLAIWMIKSKLNFNKKIIFVLGGLVTMTALVFLIPSVRNRFSEILSWKNETAIKGNTISQRVMIINCSAKVFGKNFLVGTGSRYFQEKLNKCYAAAECSNCDKQSFNPHNQYLSIGINYGIFFMIFFLIFLFMIFRKALKVPVGIYFTVAVILFFFSESMLERQMGVYFFGLMALLFYNLEDSETV
jgi:O-antigen ligase